MRAFVDMIVVYILGTNTKCCNFLFIIVIASLLCVSVVSHNSSSNLATCKAKLDWTPYRVFKGESKFGHMKYRFEYPMVIVSLKYHKAVQKSWNVLKKGFNAMEAVKAAISWCEIEANNCSGVGYGKNPDETGEPTLDATLFDGNCVCAGAVGGIRRIKHGIRAAEEVLKHSQSQVLIRDHATHFVSKHGLKEECVFTRRSECQQKRWKKGNCQPNYWQNTKPNPYKSCGPYKPLTRTEIHSLPHQIELAGDHSSQHDSMGVIAIDKNGSIVAGTSSCGVSHKIPGRIGMAAIPGSGTFADNNCCACVAIGWGDEMLKFAPAALTCDYIRQGLSPKEATQRVISKLWEADSRSLGAILAVTKNGAFGVGCVGIYRPVKYFHTHWRLHLGTFPYFVRSNFGSRRYWATCVGDMNSHHYKVNYNDNVR